ncbi:type III-A CRISPR-associated RAMP protein Csm5 [Methanocaldococcus fervens]|uniref:CRISPR system Cms protein Csm5 n=1 Tax=Methanocaldococcus fervens (strain DSM 4213 / JCM 15782 / AG86) TaxID=573064 RepID=C7P8A3_METFA|nr:type III-A CRISPR-associated RAMP protein Csm5 [Methanocaldococcus fervens]ACV24785.1 CRISPR-associated RAMP protein, Csm5 family [Methanocaldococcus fervens AG86]
MEVKCEILTPLFIGCGDEYTPLDYFIEDGKAKIVNLEKVIANLKDIEKINYISQLIMSNISGNRSEINVKELLESVGLNPEDKNYIIREIECEIKSDSRTRVKKFINQNNMYYIPGSSIKGAIRTAYVFNYYYNGRIKELLNILANREISFDEKGKVIVENAISKKISEDFFKYLIVSDSISLDGEEFKFINTKRWNFRTKRFGVKVDVEAMTKGTFNIKIKIDDKFFEEIGKKLKISYKIKDEEEKFEKLKEICNNFSKAVVEFELKRNNPVYVEGFYERLLADINKNDAIYLNLGFGGGFLTKTIYPLLWKYDKGNKNFRMIKSIFLALSGRNKNLKNAWLKANSYLDFPTTKTVYFKNDSAVAPMGWIRMEMVK